MRQTPLHGSYFHTAKQRQTAVIDLWYKNALIYSLDVDTFADGNGDGIGDFPGLTSKLDYLAGLNINCIWLLPFHPSPNRDNGYDVTDFYGVDPRLGTLGDFVEFTFQCRERGIRILIDLVVNHTSIDHPWFQEARRNADSPYRDYYVWSKEKPADAHEGMVFPGVQESTWTFDEEAKLWYLHRFYNHQPDLNVTNSRVRDEIAKIMGFWLQLGVSGFRLDAAPFLIELKGTNVDGAQRDPYEYLREFRNYLSWRRGDAVMLAEANIPPDLVNTYFDKGDKVQMLFNFHVNQRLFYALATKKAEPIRSAYAQLPSIPELCQWANFLRNHDELDLGRLSDEERQIAYREFAPEEHMRLYDRGVRRRLAPMLNNDRRRIELAYSLMLTLPGTPVVRYGDEIGMGDDLSLKERDSVRTPMQWSDEPNGGFSAAPAEKLIHPVISGGEYGYETVNVETQDRDEHSLLNWTEHALRVRRSTYEFGWGEVEFAEVGDPAVLVHRCRRGEESVLAIHNLGDRRTTVEIDRTRFDSLRDLLTMEMHAGTPDGKYRVDLDAYGYRWFRELKEQKS